MRNENEDNNLVNERMKKINHLIQKIISIKRIKIKENYYETSEIKLGRRLEQRSYKQLSEKIAFYLITRYEIDNKKLPSKRELIIEMIDFLGNIQKSRNHYRLTDNKKEISIKLDSIIGSGSQGSVYSYKLKRSKKQSKKLAVKLQNFGTPYNIVIHITSAILLAFYGFQPKYYTGDFMEIGSYPNKSIEREFHSFNIKDYKKSSIKNNIKWFVLYNFTNIADQTYNLMERNKNKEWVKIDIKRLNSETRADNIENNLKYFNTYEEIFKQNKDCILNELNKIIKIKEDFLIDLIKFRTEKGCFEITNKIISREIKSLSSCHKVLYLNKSTSFFEILRKSKENFNGYHLIFNPALTWMLYILFKKNILNDSQYNEYINKFNEIGDKYEKVSKNVGELNIYSKIKIIEIKEKDKKIKSKNHNQLNIPESTKETDDLYLNNINNECKLDNINQNINIDKDSKLNNQEYDKYDNNIETQSNNNKNKKQKRIFSFFCCNEDAVDVIE